MKPEMESNEEVRKSVERLVGACRTIVKQWDGGHTPGHDAILELHRWLKAAVPELKRNLDELFPKHVVSCTTPEELDKLDLNKPSGKLQYVAIKPSLEIICMYSCPGCGLKRVEVAVPARPIDMNIVHWVEQVAASIIGADHAMRSPDCKCREMSELMIPITGAHHIGEPAIS